MNSRLYLLEDRTSRSWSPITETRPAGEIRFGALLLRERIEQAAGLVSEGYLPDDGPPPRGTPSGLLLLSARYLPPLSGESPGAGRPLFPMAAPAAPARLVAGDENVGWLLPPTHAPAEAAPGAAGDDCAARIELPGTTVEALWDLVAHHPERLSGDLRILAREAGQRPDDGRPLPEGVVRLGREPLRVGEGVVLDPGAVLDTRSGPIRLGPGVTVRPHTHLMGPASIGEGTVLLGGLFGSLACGRSCRLRGEISHSILHDGVNKAHDGYLGHSVVGSWVNLGAMTTNSDLKNNYRPVRVGSLRGEVETGLLKLGVFLGDHVKTGIGTRLGAGTCVGAGTNIFGPGLHQKWISPFSWGGGEEFVPYRWEAFVATAERVMARRGVRLGDEERDRLHRVWIGEHGPDRTRPAGPG